MAKLSNASLMFGSMQRQLVTEGQITCYICTHGERDGDPWEAEHRVALNGPLHGAHDGANVFHAHASCNRLKGPQSL